TKDETPEVIKSFLKKIYVRLQAPVIIVRSENGTEFKNHVLKEYFDSIDITHETFAAKTPQQNGVVECRNRTLVEAARTMLIFSHASLFLWAEAIATAKPDISYLYVFGALCYPKNDREDIDKLGAKRDIGFFIGYSANFVAYRVYNQRIKKIIETMNVTFDELLAMAFEQTSSRPGLQSMTSGQISSELELTYAPSTITPQRPSERDLDILFEPFHNEYLGVRPSKAPRTILAAPVLQNLQAPTASMSFQDSAPTPINSSNTLVSSRNVDAQSQQHAQQQRNHTPSPTASAADNVPNAVFEGDLFVNPFATPSIESVLSSTQYVDPSNMHTFYQPYLHDYQWTKDHPLEQVIGEPSRSVLTRNQLKTNGDMCIYALTVNIMEPQSVKEALTDPAWIESMQVELHQFIRLDDILGIRCTQRIHNVSNGCENCILHGSLKEDVYVCQPKGFIDANHPSHVYKLKKVLYGLKQAPRAWYDELSTFLLQNGFSKSTIDPRLFTRRIDDDILVVQVYVDDIIFGSIDPRYATLFCDLMKSRFEMSTMGEMTFFLGLQVNQSPSGIFINQSNYMNEILNKYRLNTCDIIGTPMDIKDKLDLDQIGTPVDAMKYRRMIGALMYLTSSRPDIVHATCDSGFELTGFSDADYAGCKDIQEYFWWSPISWRKTRELLTDYGYHFDKIPIYCDSKSAIAISCNPVQHSRTKHIAVRYHFIKEHVEKGTIELYFVKTDYQLADIFTKALPVDRFNYLVCRLRLGLQRKENVHPCTFILHNGKFTSSRQNRRDLPKDTPIDRLEVLRYDIGKRSKVRTGIMPTETELAMEQTQQVTMEILLEPTSNKILVGDVGDSIWIELVTLDINLGPE
nr:hypothetical protein [Tanacetum cinerariifolium]